MSISYPTSIDTFTNPTGANTLASPNHATQHSNANDAIVALETKVGADGSAVTTSFDYKLSGVTGTDKAVSKTGTESLTNKTLGSGTAVTLGSDATGDMYYRNSGGVLVRLPAGSTNQIISIVGGIPTYVANPAANNGSTTVLGVFQEATQAQVDTGTTTGSTGGDLTIRPDTLRAKLYNSYIVDTGTANTYAIAPAPAITAYAVGQIFVFKAINANTTTSTLAVSGLTATTIKKYSNGALAVLVANDILANMLVEVIYDATNACFVMLNPTANVAVTSIDKNNSTTYAMNTASGVQNIPHGAGKIPSSVSINAIWKPSSGAAVIALSNGDYNGTTNSCAWYGGDSGGATTTGNSSTYAVALKSQDGTVEQTGVITVDATNIIITWTKVGSPTGTAVLEWKVRA